MDEVITFDKSLQQRLQEYTDVLSGYEVLAVSQIKKEWSFYLELAMDLSGWQAIWKMPRLTCEAQKIPFPTIVLVYIEDIDYDQHKALVKILAVQDDISLLEKHLVPIMQLWPTKEQDQTVALNLKSTANALDMLRFFYTHIFMPWDVDDDDTSDWFRKHMETRLRLFYDMKNGMIPRATAEHLKALLTEAKRLQARRELMESQLQEDEVDVDAGSDKDKRIQNLMDVHVRIIQIKSEVELLENPLMRNILIRRQQELSPKKSSNASEHWLVFEEGKIDDYVHFLNRVKSHIPNETVKFASTITSVLESCNTNDIVVLNKSCYVVKNIGGLENGGTLKGIYGKADTKVTSTSEDVMLDFSGNVCLENLTVDAGFSQCAMLVRKGKVTLKNCSVMGNGDSSTHQGIIVLGGSQLELIDCNVSGFCTAIVGNTGSTIILKDCEVHSVDFGLKIYDDCIVQAENSSFYDCREYGLCVESENCSEDGKNKIGSFDVLKIIPSIKCEELSGRNNFKGDVIINHKSKIKPVRDLFSNPELDPTIVHRSSSEEDFEMNVDELNDTVIESNTCLDKTSPVTA